MIVNPNCYPFYLPELAALPAAEAAAAGVPQLAHLQAAGYEPHLQAVPDYSNAAVVAKGKFSARVSVAPFSYLWALAGTSGATAGFKFQILDEGTKTPVFNARTYYAAVTGQGTVQGITFPLLIFERPRLILEPGILTVQVESLADVVNSIQLVLFFAEAKT